MLISGNPLASTLALYSPILKPLHSAKNGEQHEKHLYIQSRKYETFDCLIVKMRALVIN